MRYFFDTEFIEDGKTIDLLSIGIVAEDGREFYLENSEADWSKANEWVRDNVLPHLKRDDRDWPGVSVSRTDIAQAIQRFCDPSDYGKPEFWAYFADYDWVVFCQLFGRMIDLPKGFPMYCRDLKQVADMLGDIRLPKQDHSEHDALADARWNKQSWEFVRAWATEKWESHELSMLMNHYFAPHYE